MNSRNWLALDQGGHASRAIVFDDAGQLIAQAFVAIHTRRQHDHVEHDADELVQSLRNCVQDIAHILSKDTRHLVAAGLATQRSSIVCWHRRTGAALSPVLSWQDRRHAEWLTSLQPQRERIENITGLVLSPHYGASKLRWCLEHLPAVQQAQQAGELCFGPLSSYLLHALLVEQPFCVDPGNASRTQLWSPATRDWSPELLSLFGIPHAALPHCVPTRHEYGHVQVGDRRIPLRICTGDQAAVPYANGALRYDSLYLNMGTGAFVLAPLQQDLPQATPLLRSVLWSDAQHITYALEGTVNGAAAAINWYEQQTGVDVDPIIDRLDRQSVSQLTVPLFVNGVGGVGAPYWLPNLSSRFIPEQTLQDPALVPAQTTAIVESIAFLIQANIELMQTRLPQLSRLVVGGGLSRCPYLCDCLAALSGLSVIRLGERELTAKGLAYLIAEQPAEWSSTAELTQFAPHRNEALLLRQQSWRAAMALAAL